MIMGTRGSLLAVGQTGWVRDRLLEANEGLEIAVEIIKTTGDRQQSLPPESPEVMFGSGLDVSDKGIFVKEIEEAMLAGRIDTAVHSLKDLPTEQPEGLAISCIPVREDPRDVLLSPGGLAFEELPKGARIGTGSPRRASQLLAARPDLRILPVRGNVDTRIRKLMEGQFEAVILAAAGLSRLGLMMPPGRHLPDGPAMRALPVDLCLPAVGQGALALETRADDEPSRGIVAAIHHADTAAEVATERTFLSALGGGCRVPVAALAKCGKDHTLSATGIVAAPDGSRLVRVTASGSREGADDLGRRLAQEAISQGAGELLAGRV